MAEFETGIRRSMFDEASEDYAAWYSRTAVIAGEMFPNNSILAEAADDAMFVHLADLSDEPSQRTECIPSWVAVDQVEDWIAGRAAAAVADEVTLPGQAEIWRTKEAGYAYAAVESVGSPSEIDAWRAKKILNNAPTQLPSAVAGLAEEALALLAGAVRDPAIQRGFVDAEADPDKFVAYSTYLARACAFKVIDRHSTIDETQTAQLSGLLTLLSQNFISERVWGVA